MAATSPQGGGTQAEGGGRSPPLNAPDSSTGVSSFCSCGEAEGGELCGAGRGQMRKLEKTLIISTELYMMEDRLFISYLHAPSQAALRSLLNQHTHTKDLERNKQGIRISVVEICF